MGVAVSRAAPMEYVETLASLYERAGATRIPVEVVYERFRAHLQRRFSIRHDVSLEQVAQTIVQHIRGEEEKTVFRTLQEIENSRDDPSFPVKRATALVQQLHRWIARLK